MLTSAGSSGHLGTSSQMLLLLAEGNTDRSDKVYVNIRNIGEYMKWPEPFEINLRLKKYNSLSEMPMFLEGNYTVEVTSNQQCGNEF